MSFCFVCYNFKLVEDGILVDTQAETIISFYAKVIGLGSRNHQEAFPND